MAACKILIIDDDLDDVEILADAFKLILMDYMRNKTLNEKNERKIINYSAGIFESRCASATMLTAASFIYIINLLSAFLED